MSGKPSRDEHPPGSRFRLYIKNFDEDGNPVLENCGWLSVDPRVEMVRDMSDAKVFTSREEGHGSASDWVRFFEKEEPEWTVSVSWLPEKTPLRRSGPGRSSGRSGS